MKEERKSKALERRRGTLPVDKRSDEDLQHEKEIQQLRVVLTADADKELALKFKECCQKYGYSQRSVLCFLMENFIQRCEAQSIMDDTCNEQNKLFEQYFGVESPRKPATINEEELQAELTSQKPRKRNIRSGGGATKTSNSK